MVPLHGLFSKEGSLAFFSMEHFERPSSQEEWCNHALEQLGVNPDGKYGQQLKHNLREVRDMETQSEYGKEKDEAVATVITTADLRGLIPIPDDATLLRSTIESLRRTETQAAELLRHIQRELSLHLEDAGLSYEDSVLDALQQVGSYKLGSAHDTSFASRRQLAFQDPTERLKRVAMLSTMGVTSGAGRPAAQEKPYWAFASQCSTVSLYPPEATRRAKQMADLSQSTQRRHECFEEIDKSLRELAQYRAQLQQQTMVSQEVQQLSRYSTALPPGRRT